MASSKVTTIALGADTAAALAGKNRSDLDLLNAGIFYTFNQIFINFLIHFDQYFISQWIVDVIKCNTSKDTVTDRLDNLTAFSQ